MGDYAPYSNFHNFGRAEESTSEWMNMTKGEHYYFEAYHTDNNVWEHLVVAVEIEATEPPVAEEGEEQEESEFLEGHHHAMREIQTFGIEAEQIFERTRVTVTDLDDGIYILII